MRSTATHISLADLSTAGVRLRSIDAATIARELMVRASAGELHGIPSPHVIRFTGAGDILIEGPVAAGCSVERAARLLEAMLPGFDAPAELRAPGGLRLVLGRALRTLDLPAYASLSAFADALARFTAPDPAALVCELVESWRHAVAADAAHGDLPESVDAAPLTVSDVRRARRATGLSLADIAERSRIPISLLRELEWGYMVNWPAGQYGRTQLIRYARAAGLDEHVVMTAVVPELEASIEFRNELRASAVPRQPAAHAVIERAKSDSDAGAETDVPVTSLVRFNSGLPAVRRSRNDRRRLWVSALAIPALVAIGLTPVVWQAASDRSVGETEYATRTATPAPPQASADGDVAAPRPATSGPDRREPAGPVDQTARAIADPATEPPATAFAPEPRPRETSAARPASLRADGDATFSPAFASVGSAMFYHADRATGSALMRAETDPSGAVLRIVSVVDDDARNFHARPSPDGQQIAFDSDRDGERAVFVADANGGNVRRLTGEGFAAVPSWSPDGRRLAYVRAEPDRPRVWNIWMVDLESGATERLTSHRVGQPWGAAWFPDGGRIAYSHEDRLVIRTLDGKSERVHPAPIKGRLLRTPAVSPDGQRVIFQVHRDGAWLLDVADGTMRKILSDPTAEEFTWSPDGTRVAYHSRQTGQWGVWIMAPR